jgi:hypothetical protein
MRQSFRYVPSVFSNGCACVPSSEILPPSITNSLSARESVENLRAIA